MKPRSVKKIISVILALCMLLESIPFVYANEDYSFYQASPDVADDYSSHWAADAINYLKDRRIVVG